MIRYECDKCGASMRANDAQRYIVKIEVYAAAVHMDLSRDLAKDGPSELESVMKELAAANPDDIEDQTYRSFRFDVCDRCRKDLLVQHLG